jgi:uncharacterized protein (DUF697 family)/tellurite resistance protein
MDADERQALIAIAVLAARADEEQLEAERAEVEAIARGLESEVPGAVERARLAELARTLRSPERRRQAWDGALAVCRADGALSAAEHGFLDDLARELGIERVREREALADALAEAPLSAGGDETSDALIARTALWCGALELLPQGLASLAIVPLQMRMVYRLGLRHGQELDRVHLRVLMAAAGVGMTGQVLEGFARKLVGDLIGRVGGGFLRGLAGSATSAAFSYATTLALGRTAERYYAGGRKLTGAELRKVFTDLFTDARSEAKRREGDVRDFAHGLDPSRLLELVR